jgi:hypothetical protein
MSAQGVLALGAILAVLLLMLMLVPRRKASSSDDVADLADARDLIGAEIDAHVDALAERYLEARLNPAADHFGRDIELFIADVLLPRVEHAEPWLREALREIVVLERDTVYGEILRRVEAHLRRPAPAE